MKYRRALGLPIHALVRPCVSSLLLLLFVVATMATGEAGGQTLPTLRLETGGLAEEEVGRIFDRLDPARIPTGLLHDQVANLVDIARFDGSGSARISLDEWRQLYHELSRSAVTPGAERHPRGGRAVAGLPSIEQINEAAGRHLADDLIPIALLDVAFDRIRPDALDTGAIRFDDGRLVEIPAGGRSTSPYVTHRAFAVAIYKEGTARRRIRFVLPQDLYVAHGKARASRLQIDFDDGRGPRILRPGSHLVVDYQTPGTKTITLTATIDGSLATAMTTFAVTDASIPDPDLSWSISAAPRPYLGVAASYDAHIFLGAGHATITRPVIFVEGFDPNYSDPARRRTWQDIYEILLQEDFVTRLRSLGYDAVIMKLGNAADYVQRNAFALEDLLNRLSAATPAGQKIVVVGPSMGGIIGRYALAFMERNNLPHSVRLYISLDAPHDAANFPLGTQHFLEFFDGDSEVARLGKLAVNSPAARQMLAYQYRAFPNVDPLRTALISELDHYGFPSTRNIAVANGSGEAVPQQGNERVGFRSMQPGDKIIEYRYRSLFVALDGDVWALPNGTPETRIFEGLKNVFGPHYRALDVYVSGTLPYDNAPGGMRPTQQQIADSKPPYGDIKTAFPNHSWIPTTSALKLPTPDLSYHVANDPAGLTTRDLAGKRSTDAFDAIYYPSENQDHVFATDENVRFVLDEIDTRFPTSRTIAGSRTFNSGQQIVLADNVVLRFRSDVTIDPGVEFVLGANAMIAFDGRVTARGTANAPVRFTRGGASSWKWLDLRAEGNLFEHTVFTGGNKTVEVRSKNNVFRYCRFENGSRGVSSHYAVSGGRSSFALEHSLVTDNTTVGVVAYHADVSFSYTTVRRSGQAGVYFNDANSTLFHHTVVERNAVVSKSRSGVEILGGSFVTLFGPDAGRGYTRISDNTFHEINVSPSAIGLVLGRPPVRGGFNSVFDLNEGSSAASEMLLASYTGSTIFANQTYWGGFMPTAADLTGQISLGTILYDDPTSAAGAPSLLAAASTDVVGSNLLEVHGANTSSETHPAWFYGKNRPDGLSERMREIRLLLRKNPPDGADLLQELYVLQRLDPNDLLGEQAANWSLISEWRERLKRPAGAHERRTSELAVLMEIRNALIGEQYDTASMLVRDHARLIMSPDLRRRLLLEQVSLLEYEGRFGEAMAILDRFGDDSSVGEPVELYDIVREELLERSLDVHAVSDNRAAHAGSPRPGTVLTNSFSLEPAYPNPFNPDTIIPFALKETADVRVEVFDVLGRRVETIIQGIYDAGVHRASFHGGELGSGVYLVRAEFIFEDGRSAVISQHITLLK